MQIGAINSVNFKGYQKAQDLGDAEFVKPDNTSDLSGDKFEFSSDDLLEGIDKFRKDVKEAKQNVHPLTCLLGTAAAVCALTKGSKAVGWARSAVAVAGGAVANGAVKVASKVVKSVDADKVSGKINGVVDQLSKKSTVNNEKLVKPFETTVDKIFSRTVDGVAEKKGEKVVEKLNNLGIFFNPGSLFDGLVAGGIAYKAADIVSDGSETGLDKMAIDGSAKRNLGEIAEIMNIVAS